MALAEFLAELDDLVRQANSQFEAAADDAALEAARIAMLGAKSGRLKAAQKGLGQVDKADKPAAGKRFNEAKQQIDAAFEQAQLRLKQAAGGGPAALQFDPTVPGLCPRLGRLHPITQTIEEMKDIMGRLGFTVAEGPEVEDPWHNFDALNIPADHPARDPLDNFYLATADKSLPRSADALGLPVSATCFTLPRGGSDAVAAGEGGEKLSLSRDLPSPLVPRDPPGGRVVSKLTPKISGIGLPAAVPAQSDCPLCSPVARSGDAPAALLLRSQTSTVQIRVMEHTKPPVRIISLGRVYRPDTADDTHYPMFHQIEGLLVDRNVTMADLKSVLRLFAGAFFKNADVHIRFRPSFFPFTEPSVEVDMTWQGGWMEMGGAGMVDPNVLRAVGYDPDEVTGFAFGLGVERVCMNRHGIRDIRDLFRNDVRFLRQF